MSARCSARAIRILCMEEDPGRSKLLQSSLGGRGYAVETAANGEEGLDRLGAAEFDLLLLDYRMSKLSGIDVLRALATRGCLTPAIMMTAYGDETVALEALRLGAADFVVRDADQKYLELLPTLIERALANRNLVEQSAQMQEDVRKSEDSYRRLVDLSPDGIAILARGKIVYLNPAGSRLLGATRPQELIGRPFASLVHPDCRESVCQSLQGMDCGSQGIPWSERKLLGLDQAAVDVEIMGIPFCFQGTEGVQILFRDIGGRKRAEERIHSLSYYDAVTGLPNRALFKDRLKQAIAVAERHHGTAAILCFDIDDFNRINDSLGHGQGDELLRQIADRLKHCLRTSDSILRQNEEDVSDTFARIGGDDFILLLTEIVHAEDAAIVARRILEAISEPLSLNGRTLFITASIGIAVYPDDGEEFDTLLRNADSALFHAKHDGKNSFRFYEQSMNTAALRKLTLETNLRQALDRGELALFYQPQVDSRTGHIAGVEALLRWRHPEMGLILPQEFIPLAEQTGLILPIGEWVLRSACAQAAAWRRKGLGPVRVSVNLSARQFEQQGLAGIIAGVLRQSELGPEHLVPEITESTLMRETRRTVDALQEMISMGLRFMIDDFGTGYSSLAYLKRFPLFAIKINHSFVRDVSTSPDDAAITRAIISMAHHLNARVIAEYVETTCQMEFLTDHGCDEIQGFLFSRPVAVEEMTRLLVRERDGTPIVGPAAGKTLR